MNKVWHSTLDAPVAGRWILVFYSPTKTPTVVLSHKCMRVMDGAIWAYVQDLLKVGGANI